VNCTKLKDPTNVANAFNNFNIKITKKLNIQQTEKGDAVSILKIHFLETFPAEK
jgi:hypothetical protein